MSVINTELSVEPAYDRAMSNAARFPAPSNIGETTLRIVLDHLPEPTVVDDEGNPLYSQDAVRVMQMVKGLRHKNAGQETIRRVIMAHVSLPQIFLGKAPVKRAYDPPTLEVDRVKRATAEVGDQFSKMLFAMDELTRSLAAFEESAETAAPSPQRFDAFLGSIDRLKKLTKEVS